MSHATIFRNTYQRQSDLELELQKLILLIDILSLFVERSHQSPSNLELKLWKLASISLTETYIRSHLDLSDTNQT